MNFQLQEDQSPERKEEIFNELRLFYRAVHNILPESFYSEVFYHESNIYLEVLNELLQRGYFVWQVYDSWYAKKPGVTQEEYWSMVDDIVTEKANAYIQEFTEKKQKGV